LERNIRVGITGRRWPVTLFEEAQMDKLTIWNSAVELMQAFAPFYQESTARLSRDYGLPRQWYALNLAHGAEPEPFTEERYHSLGPYGPRRALEKILTGLVESGLMVAQGGGSYCLSDKGRQAIEAIFAGAHAGIGATRALPEAEMAELARLLDGIVETTLQLPEPEAKWSLRYSRWTDPGASAPAATRVDQYITDLYRYRDDAHIAAWLPLGVPGHAWEALTMIWRDRAHTAAELASLLPQHLTSAEEYEDALQGLAGRGWLEAGDGGYRLTAEGRRIREEAEATTDRFFFAGWQALGAAELDRLFELTGRATANLKQAALIAFWPLANSVSAAINPLATGVVQPLIQHHLGQGQGRRFFPLLMTHGAAPHSFSAADYARRVPYANPARIAAVLEELADEGFVVREGEGRYVIAAKGKEALDGIHAGFYGRLGEFESLPAAELEEIITLLGRIGDAALAAVEPADKYALENSRRGHYPTRALLGRIDQRLDDLNAFRDVAHIAAWQGYDVPGSTWESYTSIWQGAANSAVALAELRPNRGYTPADYSQSLDELARRSWVEADGDSYRLTDEGRRVREAVEVETDRLFYAPWAVLDAGEQARLRGLLIDLKLKLEELAAAAAGSQ
jgi:predicted transcriptional regulator/DNA-binding MarR family transcriptional regulator